MAKSPTKSIKKQTALNESTKSIHQCVKRVWQPKRKCKEAAPLSTKEKSVGGDLQLVSMAAQTNPIVRSEVETMPINENKIVCDGGCEVVILATEENRIVNEEDSAIKSIPTSKSSTVCNKGLEDQKTTKKPPMLIKKTRMSTKMSLKKTPISTDMPTKKSTIFNNKTSMPTKETPMPTKESPMSTKKNPMPTKETPMPTKKTPMPTKKTPMPTKKNPMPTKETPMPTKETSIPTKENPIPTKKPPIFTNKTSMPTKGTPMPTKEAPIPTKKSPMPAKETSIAKGHKMNRERESKPKKKNPVVGKPNRKRFIRLRFEIDCAAMVGSLDIDDLVKYLKENLKIDGKTINLQNIEISKHNFNVKILSKVNLAKKCLRDQIYKFLARKHRIFHVMSKNKRSYKIVKK